MISKADLDGLNTYYKEIGNYPKLSADEEKELGRRIQNSDEKAFLKLFHSQLKFVVFIIKKHFMGYGLPLEDLVQEGNIALMSAVQDFDPDKGKRFTTFASVCIKYKCYTYIIKNFRTVKIVRTVAQHKLFFKLRALKKSIGFSSEEERQHIANIVGVSLDDVREMEGLMYGRYFSYDSITTDEDGTVMVPYEHLYVENNNPEFIVTEDNFWAVGRARVLNAINQLPERTKDIIINRHFTSNPISLDKLGKHYNLTRERVRQIEKEALDAIADMATR